MRRRGRALRRRYGRAGRLHGPGIPWQGTDYIERRYYAVQPSLAQATLDWTSPGDREYGIKRGSELLTWLLSMNTKGAGASGKRFLEHKISDVRRMLHKAEGR